MLIIAVLKGKLPVYTLTEFIVRTQVIELVRVACTHGNKFCQVVI